MGYADGYYYGQGKFICNTANLTQGDTIRVGSLTDVSKVWNKTVATVGDIITFDVPCKDYYKVCLVQDIGGTPTEVTGFNYVVDFGQTFYVDIFDKTTLSGLQGILNAHQGSTFLNVGDEITIKVDGVDTVLQIFGIDHDQSNDLILGCKNIWTTSMFYSTNSVKTYGESELRTTLQSFYTKMTESDKPFVKLKSKKSYTTNTGWYSYSDYVWTPNTKEILGTPISVTYEDVQTQYPIFVTQSNRIRYLNSVATIWWTSDGNGPGAGSPGTRRRIMADGTGGQDWNNSVYGVLPCFYMTADS